MATTPIGRDSAPVTLSSVVPPAPAVMAILNRFNREELGNTIEVLVALLDIWDGDADNEPNGDDEPRRADGDTQDSAYIEWDKMRGSQKRGPNIAGDHEDDEEDDAPEDDDDDSAIDDGPCDEPDQDLEDDGDSEQGQMPNDVPTLPVYSAEHNIFTDRREFLGFSNLTTSFVGSDALSADSGNVLLPSQRSRKPGVPV